MNLSYVVYLNSNSFLKKLLINFDDNDDDYDGNKQEFRHHEKVDGNEEEEYTPDEEDYN